MYVLLYGYVRLVVQGCMSCCTGMYVLLYRDVCLVVRGCMSAASCAGLGFVYTESHEIQRNGYKHFKKTEPVTPIM